MRLFSSGDPVLDTLAGFTIVVGAAAVFLVVMMMLDIAHWVRRDRRRVLVPVVELVPCRGRGCRQCK